MKRRNRPVLTQHEYTRQKAERRNAAVMIAFIVVYATCLTIIIHYSNN